MATIIITGCSRGIGYELAKQAAKLNHQVLALSRNARPIQNLKLGNLHSFEFDITDDASISKVKNFVEKQWNSKVDILINNAGALVNKAFEQTNEEDFLEVYKVNVFGPAALIKTVVPYMNTDANVLNISSIGGVQGSLKFPGLAAYSSSKGAIITLTELLAEEYKDKGPHFNVMALGAVNTEMLQEAFPGYEPPTTPAMMAEYLLDFALHRAPLFNGKIIEVSNSTP